MNETVPGEAGSGDLISGPPAGRAARRCRRAPGWETRPSAGHRSRPATAPAGRTRPTRLGSQWWRTLTSLGVQDGGVAGPYAQLLWAGALVATVSLIPAVVIFAVTAPAVRLLRARGWPAARVAGGAVLACGIALAAAENIHGVALLAGAPAEPRCRRGNSG